MIQQNNTILPQSFYARKPDIVARELLGKILSHYTNGVQRAGIIVETEAYFSSNDPANHAANGKTPRNTPMYGPPGHAYVYFCYGTHWLVNAVTEKQGVASAVLIRAVQPYRGIEQMRATRGNKPDKQLTNGPGKLCAALCINGEHNTQPLFSGTLTIQENGTKIPEINSSTRIGIQKGADLIGRYYIAQNPWVSQKNTSPIPK